MWSTTSTTKSRPFLTCRPPSPAGLHSFISIPHTASCAWITVQSLVCQRLDMQRTRKGGCSDESVCRPPNQGSLDSQMGTNYARGQFWEAPSAANTEIDKALGIQVRRPAVASSHAKGAVCGSCLANEGQVAGQGSHCLRNLFIQKCFSLRSGYSCIGGCLPLRYTPRHGPSAQRFLAQDGHWIQI